MQKKGDREEKYIFKKNNLLTGFFIFCNFSSYVWLKKSITPLHDGESRKIFRRCTLRYLLHNALLRFKLVFSFARDIRLETSWNETNVLKIYFFNFN